MTTAKTEADRNKTIAVSLHPDTILALKSYAETHKRSISNATDYLINQSLKAVSLPAH